MRVWEEGAVSQEGEGKRWNGRAYSQRRAQLHVLRCRPREMEGVRGLVVYDNAQAQA